MTRTSYAIAIGSNQRGRHGSPAHEVAAAILELDELVAVSPIITTPAMGPSRRSFANAAALIESSDDPDALLTRLKDLERRFGRRAGQRWGDRVLDVDIILWSGGAYAGDGLTIPHVDYRTRRFVLDPLVAVVPEWRDPVTGRSVRQLHARLTRRRPLP
jgi:2-amino-4-hydroxy-6-hydroxymethyldihydropteridine diphosphokinase